MFLLTPRISQSLCGFIVNYAAPAIQIKCLLGGPTTMCRKVFFWLFVPVVLCLGQVTMLWAGHLVTDELRAWAKKTISQEAKIKSKPNPNTIAVLYFHNKTNKPEFEPIQKGLAVMLITDLTKIKKLQPIERVKIQALAEEMNLGRTGLMAPGSEPRVGKLLGAHFIVGGNLKKGKNVDLTTNAHTLSVPVNKLVGSAMSQGKWTELFRIEKELLFRIIEILEIELTQSELDAIKQPITANVYALLHFFKGIDKSDNGAFAQAAKFYRQALNADPEFALAADALTELERSGLISDEGLSNLLKSIKSETSLNENLFDDDVVRREIPPSGGSGTVIVEW